MKLNSKIITILMGAMALVMLFADVSLFAAVDQGPRVEISRRQRRFTTGIGINAQGSAVIAEHCTYYEITWSDGSVSSTRPDCYEDFISSNDR